MKFSCCDDEKQRMYLESTIDFLKIIAEPNRLKILCILKRQELCVCDIVERINLPQNLVSHHLKVLKDFDLLKAKRNGVKIIYSYNKKVVDKYYKNLSHYII